MECKYTVFYLKVRHILSSARATEEDIIEQQSIMARAMKGLGRITGVAVKC